VDMNHRNKHPRDSRQQLLCVKYRWRGMAKTNYRKQGRRINAKAYHLQEMWSEDKKAAQVVREM
jgi:hypothetical protein